MVSFRPPLFPKLVIGQVLFFSDIAQQSSSRTPNGLVLWMVEVGMGPLSKIPTVKAKAT